MAFVVDASASAGWFLRDEANDISADIARRLAREVGRVPDLYWHEMRNLLIQSFRRERISEAELFLSLSQLERLNLQTASDQNPTLIGQLALKHNITAYDAAYLALAKSEGLPLASFDKALRRASAAEEVTLLPAHPTP